MDTHEKTKNQKSFIVMGISCIVLLIVGIVFFWGYNLLMERDIYSGVVIKERYVGELNKKEAYDNIYAEYSENIKNKVINLNNYDYRRTLRYEDLGVDYDYQKAINTAYSIGREGNTFEKLKEIISTKKNKKYVNMDLVRNDISIGEVVKSVAQEINRGSTNATIKLTNGAFSVTEDTSGRIVDEENLKQQILDNISPEYDNSELEVMVYEEEPKIKASSLREIGRLLGSHSTSFNSSESNRTHNIIISSNSINGKIVMPGEVLSFNNSTGVRSVSNGYREAPVIIDDELVPGIGGGVCQTSTTLYNAVNKAGLGIIERHSHSKPVSYATQGSDATVAGNYLDFKFRNNTGYPVYIQSYVSGNFLNINIYGK